jgi:putative transposase
VKKSQFSDEQIVRILQEATSGQKSQAQVCREHEISQNTFYTWKRKYGGMETQDVRRLKELEQESWTSPVNVDNQLRKDCS